MDRPNYSIVNGRAFTEDNVLVYNIFVYNIPQKTTERQTLEYFKTFGEIKNVRLINDRKRHNNIPQPFKIGFVNFVDATVAAKVLQNTTHFINKKRIRVRACDSWHQPDAQAQSHNNNKDNGKDTCTAKNTPGGDTVDGDADNTTSLLHLNDDCLELIFQYLSMRDQIHLAGACLRLRNVFEMHSKLKYKHLYLYHFDNLTLWETRQFLEMAGPQIETLDGQVSFNQVNRIMEFIGLFCTNVKNVIIDTNPLKPSILRKMLRNMKQIETLELNDTELCDSSIWLLRHLPNLKVLSLRENCELTGKYIKDLKTVESLCLNGCRRLTSNNFVKICESLTKLTSLEIVDCTTLRTLDFGDVVKHLNNLETLKINMTKQNQSLTMLPKLKHLTLLAEYNLPLGFYEALAKHQSHQLESLCLDARSFLDLEKITKICELKQLKTLMLPHNQQLNDECLEKIAHLSELELLNVRNCNSFSEEGLLDLVKSCRNLRTLDIRSCKQVKMSFAQRLLKLLTAEQSHRDQKKPLIVQACRSGLNNFSICTSDFETAAAAELMQIKFDYQSEDLEDLLDDHPDEYVDFDDDDDDYDHEDMDFLGMLDDDDEDFYMYYSDPDDVEEVELGFNFLREVMLLNFNRYGDEF